MIDPDHLRQQNRDLASLNAIAQALNREVDLTQAMRTTLDKVVALFDLQTAWIWLYDDDKPYVAAVRHLPPVLTDNPRLMAGTCYCLDAYEDGELDDAANVSIITCTRLKGLVDGTDGLRSHASVPLYDAHGGRLGLLNVVSSDWRELSERELQMLFTVGDMLSIAIERAQLYEQSRRYGALEERNRLAREIHDGLAQGLTAIALRLETADVLLDADVPKLDRLRDVVRQTLELAQDNLEDVRRSVMDLRAAPLDGRTLAETVEALAHELLPDCKVDFFAYGQPVLPPRVEVGLFRVAQETLNNVQKHAGATRVHIELHTSAKEVRLLIVDDGCGFDVDTVEAEDRYGLIGQNERVHLLGGHMDLCSTPGEGTRIEVIIPLEVTS